MYLFSVCVALNPLDTSDFRNALNPSFRTFGLSESIGYIGLSDFRNALFSNQLEAACMDVVPVGPLCRDTGVFGPMAPVYYLGAFF